MRTPKGSDYNALQSIKQSGRGILTTATALSQPATSSSSSSQHHPCPHSSRSSTPDSLRGPSPVPVPAPHSIPTHAPSEALITMTVHNRVPWVQSYLVRLSQHAVLSTQTLADFVRSIPCDSSEMPEEEVDEEGDVVKYGYAPDAPAPGIRRGMGRGQARRQDIGRPAELEERCLLLIEDVVYGDGRPGIDYAEYAFSFCDHAPHFSTCQQPHSPLANSSPTSKSFPRRNDHRSPNPRHL